MTDFLLHDESKRLLKQILEQQDQTKLLIKKITLRVIRIKNSGMPQLRTIEGGLNKKPVAENEINMIL